MGRLLIFLVSLVLLGCGQPPAGEGPTQNAAAGTTPSGAGTGTAAADEDAAAASSSDRLEEVLAARPEEIQARYQYRHPKETLEFFGIEPGMTVVEALPGGGWYTRILVPYLGPDGRLIGANYPQDMWPEFGIFDEEHIEAMRTWVQDWPEQAREWQGPEGARLDAFELGSLPQSMEGQADAVLLIRALHNLARFEDDGGYLTSAIDDVTAVLKPGGIVGVVQHEARPAMPDEWASGSAGYLKKQFLIDRFTEAGLELVAESDINQNPDDQPTTEDVVWRLPPSTSGEESGTAAIGESNRMTLKFRKPQA